MSSHHIIKENQEGAVLITHPTGMQHLEPLLEWSPLIMVTDDVLDHILSWGIKTDIAITKASAMINTRQKLADQAPVRILSYAPGEDPLETAFYFMISSAQAVVTILVDDPERYFDRIEKFTDRIKIILLSEHIKWSAVPSGSFKKWFPADTVLYFRAKSGDIAFSDGSSLQQSQLLVEKDQLVHAHANGLFWIGEIVGE